MADPACVHCAGLGEYLAHDANATRYVCHCDGGCDHCNGTGATFHADDFDGDHPIDCAPCYGTGRDPHHDAKETRA